MQSWGHTQRDMQFMHAAHSIVDQITGGTAEEREQVTHDLAPLLYDFALYTLQHTLAAQTCAARVVLEHLPDIDVWPA